MSLFLFVSGTLWASVALADDDLTERLSRGDVIVTTILSAGARLPEVTARGVIDAPAASVWEVLQDCGNYKTTMLRVLRSKEISRSGSTVICEVEVDLPFPLSSLVGVTEATHVIGPPEWSRSWQLLRGDYKENTGSWTLSCFEGDPGRTLVVYRFHAEPRIRMPTVLLSQAQQNALPKVFKQLQQASGAAAPTH